MSDSSSPEWSTLIAEAIDSALANIYVAIPATVQSYDAATQTATVVPAVRRPVRDEDGAVTYEDVDPIQNVLVEFPGGTGFSMHWPLTKGDTVELVFQDYSPAAWRARGVISDPPDVRKHGPSYPFARPIYRPSGGAGPDTDRSMGTPGGLRVHFDPAAIKVGSGAQFVALANLIQAQLSALKSAISGAAVVPNDGGATFKSNILAALASWPGSVASSTLKAD